MVEVPAEIEALEHLVAIDPESESLRDQLLFAYLQHPDLHCHPRRIEQIRHFVQRFPRASACRTPAVAIDPNAIQEFQSVEMQWNRHLAECPRDTDVGIGAALFISSRDRARATKILRDLLGVEPDSARVWFQMGRIALDPNQRLAFFSKARACGETNSNLPVWIATLALEIGDNELAEEVALELLDLVNKARSIHGDKLDWPEKGRELWARAIAFHSDEDEASRLVNDIGECAYHKHWGHTVMGLLALRLGNTLSAVSHLRESGDVRGDCRLGSYGPTMSLADQLLERGRWNDVAAYLKACSNFWSDERLTLWMDQVGRKERPSFEEAHSNTKVAQANSLRGL